MEPGARLWDEDPYASAQGSDRFDVHAVLATLLSLRVPGAGSPGEFQAAEEPRTPGLTPPAAALAGVRATGDCASWEWPEHAGKYSGGYAGGVSSGFDLEGAKAKCVELGSACSAVTCSVRGTCTVRASATFGDSPSGEITYEKVCVPTPTGAPTPAPTLAPMSATQTELLQYCVADLLAR
uniref:Uncharacterized protein n=2 Tax=Alexandrium monilatum TaxID=311494 RepID=A0A7S4RUW1_9DINO